MPENCKPLYLNGRLWAIYQIENGVLFLHMLNPHNLRKRILDEIEQDFIFLIGAALEPENEFDKAAYLNLSPDEVKAFCEKIPQKQ